MNSGVRAAREAVLNKFRSIEARSGQAISIDVLYQTVSTMEADNMQEAIRHLLDELLFEEAEKNGEEAIALTPYGYSSINK